MLAETAFYPAIEKTPSLPAMIWGQIVVPPEELPYLQSIREWIFCRTGLHFGERKQFVLYKRLQSLCWRLGISGLEEIDRQLHAPVESPLAAEVACAVSTHHTFFCREMEILERIPQLILPQLPPDEPWRIWSAASSSGEEAYTVAMLVAEALGVRQIEPRAAILGTDISHPMIDLAEHGIYMQSRMERVPPHLRERYFLPVGLGQWRVAHELRQACTFRQMNLQSAPWPFKNPFHMVLCRNVLYYFDVSRQEELVERLYDATVPGGWLITSVTETLHGLHTRWRRVDSGIFRKG